MAQQKKTMEKSNKTARKPAVDSGTAKVVKTRQPVNMPIVGIGASAGGLEALELFLSHMPPDCGMAFVIVQHLDPTRKGILVELLQRCTSMKVLQVKDRVRMEANCVYVIPPNKDLSILHGSLHLIVPSAPRGLRLPIDFFFRALASDQQENSIGVILSGMGSDGTLGLRAIKEKAGAVFVQEPGTAKFDSMPRSVVDAGLADIVAPAEALPAKIIAYLQHLPLVAQPGFADDRIPAGALEKVVILLRGQTGHDFSMYKKTTICRRIERRMALHQIAKVTSYVRYLQETPHEVELLFRELLIGVTNFFRDAEAWEQLKKEVLPALISGEQQTLRAWVAGCATGEEAYSLAILFAETLEKLKPRHKVTLQIFATDLDPQAIEKAREGIFPANIVTDVSAKRLERFFVKRELGYQVSKAIREMVIFAPQNLIMEPPFTRLDLVCCRNLLIYLNPELQKKILPLFYYSLNPRGFLFLGSAETVGNFNHLFAALAGKNRLYRKVESAEAQDPMVFPTNFLVAPNSPVGKPLLPQPNLQTLAEQLLLQKHSPAAVLTNDKGDILYTSGRTGKYLEPAAGRANWNIFVMAREGLHYEISAAFKKALRQQQTVTIKNLVVGTNGGRQVVDLSVEPLSKQNALQGMMLVVFTDVAIKLKAKTTGKLKSTSTRVAELQQDLERTSQEVQIIREEMQASQEELRSSNEELQSTNEELQSTNEELTTSKEEMQSMNEEMQTVNQELQTRLEELSRTNNDMKNLLDSTNIATLFLDNTLHVRRFTSETSKITKLIPGDVGRPITDIASALLYPDLVDDVHEVLRTLVKVDRQIPIPDGNWFAARILPYRTMDNRIDGVVITFTDITISKKLEADLRSQNSSQ